MPSSVNPSAAPAFRKHFPPLFFVLTGWIAGTLLPFDLPWQLWAGWVFPGLVLMLVFHLLTARWDFLRYAFMFVAVLTAMTLGGTYAGARNMAPDIPADLTDKAHLLQFEVTEKLKPSSRFRRYFVRVYAVDSAGAGFGALLYVPVGDSVLLPGQTYAGVFGRENIKALPRLRYPHGFDYANYLKRRYIYRRLFAPQGSIEPLKHRNKWRYAQARMRERVRAVFRKYLSAENFPVASALLLGERQDLDTRTREAFIDAGVVHILAISGMHIGILLFFLRFLFSPFRIRHKWLYHGGILAILWFYAWLTGFSPSVLRAVIMFGFFQLAWESEREVSGLHILALSAFVILLMDPSMIRNVGFQLSFAAVASIILFFPLFKKIYYPRQAWLRYLVDLLYVSFAAQFGVAPLVLLYFHRFSFGFVVSNFLVIPLLTVVLGLGFLSIALILFRVPAGWILRLLDLVMGWMNTIIHRIAVMEIGVMKDIYFSPLLAVAWLVFFTGLFFWWQRPRGRIGWLVAGLTGFLMLWTVDYGHRTRDAEWVLTAYNTRPLLLGRQGRALHIFSDTVVYYAVPAGFMREAGVKRIDTAKFPAVFNLNGKRYLLLNAPVDPADLPRAEALILNRSPKVNLDMVINRTGAKQLIVMPQNYTYLRRRWQQTAGQRHLSYKEISREGFVVLGDSGK